MERVRTIVIFSLRQKTSIKMFRNFSLPTVPVKIFTLKGRYHILSIQSNFLNGIKFLPTLKLSNDISSSEVNDLVEKILYNNTEEKEPGKKDELVKVVNFLLSHGCTTRDIKEKCIQYIDSSNNSYLKAVLLAELASDIATVLPLMSLSIVALRLAAKQARDDKYQLQDFPNRISYLAHHLDTSPADLICALTKHHSLLTMKFLRLKYKMDILKNAEISPKYLIKDLWIFNYNEKLLVKRIAAAEEAGVDLKPWMLRSSEQVFNSVLSKYTETQRILNGDDEVTYLAKKLDCNLHYIEYIMEKNKLLKAINIPKLEQVLNFLYSKGYTAQEVRLFPRVFCSSVKTLSKRFEDESRYRNTIPTISQLCASSKKFQTKMKKQKELKYLM